MEISMQIDDQDQWSVLLITSVDEDIEVSEDFLGMYH